MERAAVQLWVSIATLVLLFVVTPTLAWLVHAFLRFRAKVEERLLSLPVPGPAPLLPTVAAPVLPVAPPELEGPSVLPDFFGPDAPRASSPTPAPPLPRSTRLPPRRG